MSALSVSAHYYVNVVVGKIVCNHVYELLLWTDRIIKQVDIL